jgi:hypothetical protein
MAKAGLHRGAKHRKVRAAPQPPSGNPDIF